MQKYCDLELRLFPTSSSSSDEFDSKDNCMVESTSSGNIQPKEESEMITIFYNGKMCISTHVTHLQAKSIISMANIEMEERSSSKGSDLQIRLARLHQHQLPNPKASMKRSLQSFLQKRTNRIQATSPYHQHSRR